MPALHGQEQIILFLNMYAFYSPCESLFVLGPARSMSQGLWPCCFPSLSLHFALEHGASSRPLKLVEKTPFLAQCHKHRVLSGL